MRALIKREFFILKHNLISYICVWTLLPMTVYLFISVPLSSQISTDAINYINWSSIGNAVYTSSLLAYIISFKLILSYKDKTNFSHLLLSAPQTNLQHLGSIVSWATIIGFVQLLFSIVLTQALNSSNLFFLDIFMIILYALPVIVISSNIAIFVGLLTSSMFIQSLINTILGILLLFSSGLFVPIDRAPAFFSFSPIYYTIINIQNIITIDSSVIYPSIIVLVISAFIFIVNLIISHKVLRK